jgi:hypothetical protein
VTPEERAFQLATYRDGVEGACHALLELDAALMDRAPEGEWSARQIAHHLADAELFRAVRLRRLPAQDRPTLQSYDEQALADRLHYYRPVEASVALYQASAQSNLELIGLVFPEDWEREAVHEETGRYTLDDWLRNAASHAADHLEQLHRVTSSS